jgi:hypothetical protein
MTDSDFASSIDLDDAECPFLGYRTEQERV